MSAIDSAQAKPTGSAQARSVPAQNRLRQAWTIATIELRRAFFAKRSLWVYALALLPSVIFTAHGLEATWRVERLARHGLTPAMALDSVRQGDALEDVRKRLGE